MILDENPNGSNTSSNPSLPEMIEQQMSRRSVLVGALGTGAVTFLGGTMLSRKAEASSASSSSGPGAFLSFPEVPPSSADTIQKRTTIFVSPMPAFS